MAGDTLELAEAMDAIDKFDTVAEIAITLAGFSGLVMALKSGRSLSQEDLRRIIYIVSLSFTVLATALLPAILTGFDLSEDLAFKSSCLILALFAFVLGLNGVVSWRRARITPHFPKATALSLVLALVTAIALFLGVADIWISSSPGLLLAAHLILLLIDGWVFVSTIIWTGSKESETETWG